MSFAEAQRSRYPILARLFAGALALMWAVACGPSRALVYQDTSSQALFGMNKRALVAPLDTVHTRYRDNTRAEPDTQFNDSFLLSAVRRFVAFETAQHYAPVRPENDSSSLLPDVHYSILTGDTAGLDSATARIVRLAQRYQADLVVIAPACTTGHRVYQPQGWRRNTGPGYSRPVEAEGFASCHVQIWSAEGKLLFERVGKATIGKPLLYNLFNGRRGAARRAKAIDEDIVAASRKLYAPPVLRALARATGNAFLMR
jgi:hypothetical protein